MARFMSVMCCVKECENNVRSGFRRCVSCMQGWTPEKRKAYAEKKAKEEEE
tara:strand:+ start:1985 stop:2137 length:153 start_codon:yes stop_codon:yes gene_type:complete